MKTLISTLILGISLFAQADEKKNWYEEGFVEGANQEHRAALSAVRVGNSEKWHLCSAIREAQFKHIDLYVHRDSEKRQQSCFSDSDCGIGSLGGFCSVVAHKQQLAGYSLYTRSSTYNHLSKEWSENKCTGPVGLCMPVNKALCEKVKDSGVGVCKGTWAKEATLTPTFMTK